MGRHDQGTESPDTRSWRGGKAAEEEEAAGGKGIMTEPMGVFRSFFELGVDGLKYRF